MVHIFFQIEYIVRDKGQVVQFKILWLCRLSYISDEFT